MSLFFTSDQHYNHYNIIEYCNRPFTSTEDMNGGLILRHNEAVRPEDTVIHVGDFAFMSVEGIADTLARLNGTHILVRGNHDKSPTSMLKAGFAAVFEKLTVKLGRYTCTVVHNKTHALAEDAYVIHGHTHSTPETRLDKNLCTLDVGVDAWHYVPVSATAVLNCIREMGL